MAYANNVKPQTQERMDQRQGLVRNRLARAASLEELAKMPAYHRNGQSSVGYRMAKYHRMFKEGMEQIELGVKPKPKRYIPLVPLKELPLTEQLFLNYKYGVKHV